MTIDPDYPMRELGNPLPFPTIAEAEAEAARLLADNPMGGPEWDRACDILLCAMYAAKKRMGPQPSYHAREPLSVSL